ncbi:MAG: hypothetical protein KBD60_02085 [Sterolibacterium sp.]|nr:hypothetical protein [Sterolibacterium sp.]
MNRRNEWRSLISDRPAGNAGWLSRLLSYGLTLALLGLGLMFSFILFAVLAVVGVLVGGWFWWKTRALRRELAQASQQWQTAQQTAEQSTQSYQSTQSSQAGGRDGMVIEGDARRVEDESELLTRSRD